MLPLSRQGLPGSPLRGCAV